jgi:hypothetical protein
MIKLFEEFFEEYKSIYERDPRSYKREPEFDKLVLKTRGDKDYIIDINYKGKQIGNFTKDEMEMIWEDFQPIYDSYSLSLPESLEDYDTYKPNIVHFGVAANAYMDIFIEGDLEEVEEFENDMRSFISGLDKLGIKAQFERDEMEFDDESQGYEISITFFKKQDYEYEED